MKFHLLLALSLISAYGMGQEIGYGPSLSFLHYPSWNFQVKSMGMQLLFPAQFSDSNSNAISISSCFNEFNPSIQNQAIGFIGTFAKTKFKLGLAKFGNTDFNLQAGFVGIQLKLSDRLGIGTEFHLSESRILNYKNQYLMGTALGFCLQLHPAVIYMNKLGLFRKIENENNWVLRQEYLHLLSIKTKEMLTLNLAMMKYLEQNQSLFSIGYQLQFSPKFSNSMTYQTGTKSIALGLNICLQKLLVNMEIKYNQALGLGYLLGLSRHFKSMKKNP